MACILFANPIQYIASLGLHGYGRSVSHVSVFTFCSHACDPWWPQMADFRQEYLFCAQRTAFIRHMQICVTYFIFRGDLSVYCLYQQYAMPPGSTVRECCIRNMVRS